MPIPTYNKMYGDNVVYQIIGKYFEKEQTAFVFIIILGGDQSPLFR